MKNKRKGIEAIKRALRNSVRRSLGIRGHSICRSSDYYDGFIFLEHCHCRKQRSGDEVRRFSNYYRLLFKNTVYVDRLAASLSSVFTSLPIIVSLLAYIGDNS